MVAVLVITVYNGKGGKTSRYTGGKENSSGNVFCVYFLSVVSVFFLLMTVKELKVKVNHSVVKLPKK